MKLEQQWDLMKTAIVAIPRLEPHRPPPGAAIVAAVCRDQGHDVTAYDLNIKLFQYCKHNDIDYHAFDSVFDLISDPTPEQLDILTRFIDHWAQVIADENFDYVMVSVFGQSATWFARRFFKAIRDRSTVKIVAGGPGVNTWSLIDPSRCFGEEMRQAKLVDDYLVGEAEVILVRYLNGEQSNGINNTVLEQIDDIENLPPPDYGYFDLNEYDYLLPGRREVYITGSRGCVRKCTYCDIERYWPKYRYRSGTSLANEIINNYERFGVSRYYFTDSLINGSLKVFADMCDKLASYPFAEKISWGGQFIFRQRKSIPKDHFATIAAAGGDMFLVGFETGSDRVRKAMGKNYSNDDIEFQLEECSKNNISIIPLMFTGYLTETIEDHHDTLDMFRRWQRFVADGTIPGIELGQGLGILSGAPVANMIESHGIHFLMENDEPHPLLWQTTANPELTIREQLRRKLEVHYTAIKYNWPVWRQYTRLQEFRNLVFQHELWKDRDTFYKITDIPGSEKRTVIPIRVVND